MNINIFPNDLLTIARSFSDDIPQFFMVKIEKNIAENLRFLNNSEKNRFAEYSLAKRQREWLSGRYCLKRCAAAYAAITSPKDADLQKYEVINREDGRPSLLGSGADISISHSKDYGLAMISDTPCGIDIQQAVPTLIKVQDRYCTTGEEQLLSTLPHDALLSMAMLWSTKEAVQKCLTYDEKMPGFLELVLVQIDSIENTTIFSLQYTKDGRIFQLPVTTMDQYAIAYLQRGINYARIARS